ncbi:MAG TPA: hypothetical protein VJ302_23785 [Blastocatellia bacterium]|nr:hypothetical protein [Blastocatellia bacterium]
MKSQLFMIVICLLGLELPRISSQDRPSQDPSPRVLTATDFRDGTANAGDGTEAVTFLIEISPKLPPYKIRVIPDLTSYDAPEGYEGPNHAGRIVIQNSSSKPQVIEVEAFTLVNRLVHFFKAEDINFDGYLDLAVLVEYGAKWGRYQYWLFDKKSGRFVSNSLTRRLGRLTYNTIDLDPKAQEITLGFYLGVCAQSETYRVLSRTLLLTAREERECVPDGTRVRLKRRIHGKWRLIKTEVEKF